MGKPGKKNSRLSQSIGEIKSWEATPAGITVKAENAMAEISFYEPRVVRVNIYQHEEAPREFSYAVVAEPQTIDLQLEESSDSITLHSTQLTITIQKSPFRVLFYAADGKLLNEDDAGFGTSWIGNEVTTYKKLQDGERFIGMGEKTGNLDRRGSAYVHWNTDNFAYSPDDDPIYLSTPFFIGVWNQKTYGIFLDNTHKSTFNFGASNHRFASFGADDGAMNYYFIHGDGVPGIIEAYSELTGKMPLPPRWSLGYHQCRYSYYPDSEVLTTARTFREKGFPADVIYLDIHYMDAYKVFTFHPDRFPDPKKMSEELAEMGFRLALIVDPGIKEEAGYSAYEEGLEKDYFVTYPDGEPWKADVWPGTSAFPDFTREEVRDWWGKQTQFYADRGVSGFWNDMNEPASWGQAVPDLIEFDYDGERSTHKKAHNIYGMQMARATYEGTRKHLKGERPFVLTRAGFSGIQRYATVWTGDNVATDAHMMLGVRLVNSLGLAGIPFSGPDVGGFAGAASVPLFVRWMQVGAFTPFFRGHSMVNSRDAEPWSFGEEAEEINRNFIRLRYRMMPYIYSLFEEASRRGLPVARSLTLDWPHEPLVYDGNYQNQFLLGDSLLVCPVESTQKLSKVFLPGKGTWWLDFYTGRYYEGGMEHIVECPMEKLPLFFKGGGIIPMQSQVLSLAEAPEPVLHLHIFPGEKASQFHFYDDDGKSYDFENGNFYSRDIVVSPEGDEDTDGILKLTLNAVNGTFETVFNEVKVYFYGAFADEEGTYSFSVNGEKVTHQWENFSHFEPISAFDPFYGQKEYGTIPVITLQFPLINAEQVLIWNE